MSLRIDTSLKPVHKTSLTSTELSSLKGQVAGIDPDDSNDVQYSQINDIVKQMAGKFENEYDAMEIAMLQTTLDAIINRKKRGSKPYELINVITKVLERVTNTSGGRRLKRTRRNRRRTKKVYSV